MFSQFYSPSFSRLETAIIFYMYIYLCDEKILICRILVQRGVLSCHRRGAVKSFLEDKRRLSHNTRGVLGQVGEARDREVTDTDCYCTVVA